MNCRFDECAEQAPVTYVSSNPAPASATFPGFETTSTRTAGSRVLGLGLVLVVLLVLWLGELLPGLAVCLGDAAR